MNSNLNEINVFHALQSRDPGELKALSEALFNGGAQVRRTIDVGVTPDEYTRLQALQQVYDTGHGLVEQLRS